MREILFRAKRIDNGEWVEGYYIYHIKRTPCVFNDMVRLEDEQHVIMCDGFSDWNMPRGTVHYDVDRNTLCQYTGLTDKNGNKIWENDIIKFFSKRGIGDNDYYFVASILWNNRELCFIKRCCNKTFALHNDNDADDFEVIGNIFDNPELVKGE